MSKKLLFVVLCLFIFKGLNAVEVNIGFLNKHNYLNESKSKIALKTWSKIIDKRKNKINVTFYRNELRILRDFKERKIDCILISPVIYLEKINFFKNKNFKFFSFQKGSKRKVSYYLIKHKSKKHNLNKIKLARNSKNKIARLWFESFILKKYKKTYNSLVSKEVGVDSEAKVIYEVFFNKNSYGIVSDASFEKASSFNPQLKEQIDIMAKSISFPIIFGIYNTKMKNEKIDELKYIMNNFNSSKDGQNILSLASLSNVYYIRKNSLGRYEKFYKMYEHSKRLYGRN